MAAASQAGDGPTERKKLFLYLDMPTRKALKRWADARQRSMSAQARVVLDEVIPAEFYDPDERPQREEDPSRKWSA